ncbi:DNA polymerase III subunit delta' [Neoactinobaculum massilliense]|uniref:DNA polymerase III subunit delta' n=1 Tax=Neoactinobaculum massilliense TaxID=2364794 RepID=UPI000F52FB6C|nr:DNA polymerase III subunit delta' [Neoactinobaculum massilliense]
MSTQDVFEDLVGQGGVVQQLRAAARASRLTDNGTNAMSQAWLLTGPPGSGRSVAATAFAAALECTENEPGAGRCHACRTVMAKEHPDVEYLTTQAVGISVEATREAVAHSYAYPTVGNWRVIIIEDADRMSERTSNVLLKAIEEPPEHTVWILSAPSAEDMLPTIRSRCRLVHLAVPAVDAVAGLLERKWNVPSEQAEIAARAAQAHIGRAHALATDLTVREERERIIRGTLGMVSVGDAVLQASRIFAAAKGESKGSSRGKKGDSKAERRREVDEREMEELKERLGIAEGRTVPPSVRSQLRDLEEAQKRRDTRQVRDDMDRALIDLLSVYRDVLAVQLKAGVELVNMDFERQITSVAADTTPLESIRRLDAISAARRRLQANVAPQLTLEALMVQLLPR